jgi:PAS domain S-box-containing protein/diguanylate cyclase (GGDEF)-like protein
MNMTTAALLMPDARILIVDDQEANVAVLQAILTQAGYSSLTGMTDPRLVVAHCQAEEPDLIILDLHMPHLDGFAVMEQVQEITPPESFLPILVLTADISLETRRRALELGAQDFISKPFDRVEVLLRVRNLLQTRSQYRAQSNRLRALSEFGAELTAIVGEDSVVRYASPSFERVLGYQPHALLGQSFLSLVSPDDQQAVRSLLESCQPKAVEGDPLEYRIRHVDGSWRSVEGTAVNRRADPAVDGIIVAARDVTAQHTLAQEMRQQATHDPVTRLPNRLQLQEALHQALKAGKGQIAPFALLVIQLDGIADAVLSLSHGIADKALQEVAERLATLYGPSHTLARLSDTQLALLLPGMRMASATWAARKILAALARPVVVAGITVPIRAVVGIALCPDNGDEADGLLSAAVAAATDATRSPDGYCVCTSEQAQLAALRRLLGTALPDALANNEFVLHYLPKLEIRDGTSRVIGVEALIRWTHPAHGLLAPGQFISLAEQQGLIDGITRWTLVAGISQWHAWSQIGLSLSVSINISMRSLLDPTLPATIATLLRRFELPPQFLVLEVTESALTFDQDRTMTVLTKLAALGVRISVDNFGTGYSSLAHLRHLPLTEVKIDRSFVQNLFMQPQERAIVESMIALGHKLGLTVVAQGVEDHRTLSLLRSLNCDKVQGFYFTQPLPAAGLKTWLDRSKWGIQQVIG